MRKQTGFTLIEILVTVIVVAIGLLGLAGLQATALKFNSTAYQRSQATILIYDIIERIRANPNPQSAVFQYIACNLNPASASCTGIVQQDIQAWQNAIALTLPGATIPPDIIPGNILTIRIRWNDSRGQDALRDVSIRTNL